ncbi:MAG: hypothetical protein CMJ36_03110 [Phycisphaerae bacterium]|nr:hypothetical protein [Phycisphaerae bacterium]
MMVLVGFLGTLLVQPEAQAQRRSMFLVQAMSIEDLRDLTEDLELSRAQQAALMPIYERYTAEVEQLLDRDVAELIDRGIGMSQRIWTFGRGQISIPERKELEELVDLGLGIYDEINRIDSAFFDSINMLDIETQLASLERFRRRRLLANYIMPHFMLASRMNEGISFSIHEWIDRQDLSQEQLDRVHVILDELEVQAMRHVKEFEDDLKAMVKAVLDLVDELGIRNMDMQSMMAMAQEEGFEQRMRTFFDEESKAIQKTTEKMSRMNLRAARQLEEVLPPELWLDMTIEYAGQAYSEQAGKVGWGDSRFKRAMKLEGITDDQEQALQQARADYRAGWKSNFPRVADALEDQRAYRTSAMFEGDVESKDEERVRQAAERVDRLVGGVEGTITSMLTAEQLALFQGDEGKKEERGRNPWSRRSEAVASTSGGRSYEFPMAPMEAASIEQFSAWLELENMDQGMLESLYEEYNIAYESMADEYDRRLVEGYEGMGEGGNWRERRQLRRDAREELMPKLQAAEDAFFQDMEMVLPENTMPELLEQIRISNDRSRRRNKIWLGNWSLRGQTEAAIDLGEIILAIDPKTLQPETREELIEAMIGYNAACSSDMDAIERELETIRDLEQRLWSEDSSGMSDELREMLRNRWQQSRSKMSEIASRMGELNRSVYEGVVSRLPDTEVQAMRNLYERKAYPDVFEDDEPADEQIAAVMDIEDLSEQQRMGVNDIAFEYRSDYRNLTDQMLEQVRLRQKNEQSWPPNADAMRSYMKMETLRYQRRQLNDWARIMIEMLLTDQQIAMIPGLGRSMPEEGEGES